MTYLTDIINSQQQSEDILHAISLFSNCGAGDLGYRKAGFTFDVMAEIEKKRLEVCLLNHPNAIGIPGDLRDTWQTVVETYRTKTSNANLTLLAACPPCQGMSSARGLRGQNSDPDAGSKDERNLLAVIIEKVAKALNPQIIVVENVPEFLVRKVRHPKTQEPVTASNLLIELLLEDYKVFPVLVDLSEFNIPQTRKRTFLTFIRRDSTALTKLLNEGSAPYPLPSDTPPITISKALSEFNLPTLDASKVELSKSDIYLHSVPTWPIERYDMVAAIPPHSGASAWQNSTCPNCNFENNQEDVKCKQCDNLLLKPIFKNEDGTFRLIKGFATSYKRMASNKPASTILTESGHIGSHNTLHPYENRVLSTLECAYLQTFDNSFDWGETLEKWGHSNIRAMIGEAVPPRFTYSHGKVLIDLFLNNSHCQRLSINDSRCKTAWKKLRKNTT